MLRIQRETDITNFERDSQLFINEIFGDGKTKNFARYFIRNYMTRPQHWAFCHRLNAGINTNMKVQRWHRAIKYEEAEGKIIKRLYKSLIIVLNAI